MKKKCIYTCLIILIVILLIGICVYYSTRPKDDNIENISSSNNIANTSDSSTTVDKKEPAIEKDSITIKSSENNTIEKDGIEATKIDVEHLNTTLKVSTVLKNNSNEDVKGFYIVIALLDKDGKTVTTIAKKSNDTIKAKGEIALENNVSGLKNAKDVVNAKIVTLNK